MSTESQPSRDALAKLRIKRDDDARPPARPGRLGKVLLLTVGLLLLVGVLAAVGLRNADVLEEWAIVPEAIRPRPEVRVGTVVVESGRSADALVVATGYLESRRQAKIGARATGRLDVIHIEEGSHVTEDQVLAILEHADLDAALAAARATLRRAEGELNEHRVEVERSKRELDRAKELYADGTMSEADYDTADFQHQGAVARVISLEAAVALAEARVRESEQLKENMFIRAPFDGTVISKDAEVGESIMPGGMGEASGRGSVATIADLQHLEVECDVKEDYIARVKPGQSAEVAVDAVPDYRYQGLVRKIIPMGDRARATIKVQVEILDADERLFPEMSSTVYFLPEETAVADTSKPRVFCRNEALVTDASGAYVFVVDDENRLRRRSVQLGAKQDARTEITSGLSGGERVVLSPSDRLRDGRLVKIAE